MTSVLEIVLLVVGVRRRMENSLVVEIVAAAVGEVVVVVVAAAVAVQTLELVSDTAYSVKAVVIHVALIEEIRGKKVQEKHSSLAVD